MKNREKVANKIHRHSIYESMKREIKEAYLFLRKNNQSIPSETLEFIKESALKELDSVYKIGSTAEKIRQYLRGDIVSRERFEKG